MSQTIDEVCALFLIVTASEQLLELIDENKPLCIFFLDFLCNSLKDIPFVIQYKFDLIRTKEVILIWSTLVLANQGIME